MAISIIFTPPAMNTRQYDEIIRRLEAAGASAPPGRLYHVCFGAGDRLRVLDSWESQESFDAFSRTLMPILEELGIDPGQPEISEIHNLIEGGSGQLDLTGVRIGDPNEANKAVVRRFLEVVNRRDPDRAAEIVAADLRWHGGSAGEIDSLAGLQQLLGSFFTAFPDLQVGIEEMIAEGDRVVSRISATGTHRAEFQGVPPTGRKVTITGITLYRIADGKIVEEWWHVDLLGLMQQLGAIPAPA